MNGSLLPNRATLGGMGPVCLSQRSCDLWQRLKVDDIESPREVARVSLSWWWRVRRSGRSDASMMLILLLLRRATSAAFALAQIRSAIA